MFLREWLWSPQSLQAVLLSTPACHQLISTAVRSLCFHSADHRCCFLETILVLSKSLAFSWIPCHLADVCSGRILPALSLSVAASPRPQQSNPPHLRAPLHLCSQPPFIHCIQFFDFSPSHLICSPSLRTWSGATTQDTNEHSTVKESQGSWWTIHLHCCHTCRIVHYCCTCSLVLVVAPLFFFFFLRILPSSFNACFLITALRGKIHQSNCFFVSWLALQCRVILLNYGLSLNPFQSLKKQTFSG